MDAGRPEPDRRFDGFTRVGELSLKGKFAVWGNIIGGVLLIAGIVSALLIFVDFDEIAAGDGHELIMMMLYLLLGFVGGFALTVLMSMAPKAIGLKALGAGKVHVHFGGVIEVYADRPVKKWPYMLVDQLAILLTFIILIVFAIVFAGSYPAGFILYTVAFTIGANYLANLPLIIFLLRQPRGSYIGYDKGKVLAFKRDENANDK